MEKASLSKRVRFAMRMYYEQELGTIGLGITKIAVQKNDGTIYVRITSERPGLIIGKAGRTIDGLSDHLVNVFLCKIDIALTESNIWG